MLIENQKMVWPKIKSKDGGATKDDFWGAKTKEEGSLALRVK